MDIALSIEAKYRERPDQNAIGSAGNEYLKIEFPDLDFIQKGVGCSKLILQST